MQVLEKQEKVQVQASEEQVQVPEKEVHLPKKTWVLETQRESSFTRELVDSK